MVHKEDLTFSSNDVFTIQDVELMTSLLEGPALLIIAIPNDKGGIEYHRKTTLFPLEHIDEVQQTVLQDLEAIKNPAGSSPTGSNPQPKLE